MQDAYKSIIEALQQAGVYNDRKVRCHFINSENITNENVAEMLQGMAGYVICPGFGQRGTEGKLIATRYCREQNLPTFGICLGMQMMVVEFARNVLGYADANSTELNSKTKHNVIDIMEEQKNITNMGGTNAPWWLRMRGEGWFSFTRDLRKRCDSRTSPPSLRIQQRLTLHNMKKRE